MTIQVQVEKALFVAQEMELALMLAERCATDFRARSCIARHVLVRAKDFIALTGALIEPMRDAGFAVEGLRSRRTVYMAAFDEYYSTSRTRLAAHVQDLWSSWTASSSGRTSSSPSSRTSSTVRVED